MKRIFAALLTMLALSSQSVPQQNKQSPALSKQSPALSQLVAAERAFASTSVEKGIRESFLEFFSDEAINFQPHPQKARAAILSRPAPAKRPPVTLNWEPVWADVSAAGDLGYTTGPYTLTDNSPEKAPTRHGYYFSVWKRQPDGNWKVAIDVGIQVPAPAPQMPAFHAVEPVRMKGDAAPLDPEAGRAALLQVERDLLREAQSRGFVKTFLEHLASESRLHRQGMLPLVGREAISAHLSSKAPSATWEPMYSDVARSGDLGYVYGSYELRDNPGQASAIEKGYYVRVWKRGADGKWKVALDLTHPVEPEQK